ncbi:hypothetical protein DITRI_Ditri20bG0037000 [Diplodiscus trichospermus]
MGHITLVGPTIGVLEARLNSMLNEQGSENQTEVAPRVGIIMGSYSDLPVMKDAARILDMFSVSSEVRTVSAHRTPELMFSYASSARKRGIQVIIAGAGGAAHLPSYPCFHIGWNRFTLINCAGTLKTRMYGYISGMLGVIHVLMMRMPMGVPVATVAVNNAKNAGLLAVRMLGIGDADLFARMSQYKEGTRDNVLTKAKKLQKDGWEESKTMAYSSDVTKFTVTFVFGILLLLSFQRFLALAARPLDEHQVPSFNNDILIVQSLQKGPVPPSGRNPCTNIPGRSRGRCTLTEMNVVGGGGVARHSPPPYPDFLVNFAAA